MCQMSAVVEKGDGSQDLVMETVTALEVLADGVILKTFFEDPLTMTGVFIKRIDFLGGEILLGLK